MPDTLPPDRRIRLPFGGLVSRYAAIGRDRGFLSHAAIGGCGMFSMFAYLGGSPPIFIDLFHLSPPQYGLLFGGNAACYIFASQINARIVPVFGASRMLTAATAAFLAATAFAAVLAWMQTSSLIAMLMPLTMMWASLGFMMPNAAVGALSRHAAHAASASALMGTLQFILGAISGTLIGVLGDGTARPMGAMLLLGGVGAALAKPGAAASAVARTRDPGRSLISNPAFYSNSCCSGAS